VLSRLFPNLEKINRVIAADYLNCYYIKLIVRKRQKQRQREREKEREKDSARIALFVRAYCSISLKR